MERSELKKGDRIELHPATDLCMRGARYGDVTAVGRSKISVKIDRIVRVIRVAPENILRVVGAVLLVLFIFGATAEARGYGGHHGGGHHGWSRR
jgi:hypothetical protein